MLLQNSDCVTCMISTDGLGDPWANPFGTQATWRAAAAQEVFDFFEVPERMLCISGRESKIFKRRIGSPLQIFVTRCSPERHL